MVKGVNLSKNYLVLGAVLVVALLALSFMFFEGLTGNAVSKVASSSKLPLTEKKVSSTTSTVSSVPQPAPPPRPASSSQGSQCSQCGKEYEFRTVSAGCGVSTYLFYEDVGIDASCEVEDRYRDAVTGSSLRALTMTASCQSGKIVSYGVDCPRGAVVNELRPPAWPYVADYRVWSGLPELFEIKASCEKVLENDDSMQVYVTCIREKVR